MPTLTRHRLPNGLRVVLLTEVSVPRAAVAVHVGVGFRHEGPAEEGLAHLFEHLMFRGSASLPGGGFGDEVYGEGGRMSGTTHLDYTDYVQVVPATELRRALFRDAERFRAPTLDEEEIARQLDGIAQEVAHARDLPPLGGFPWPLVSRVAYGARAHAHDGYGHLPALRAVGAARCREFFDRHYRPHAMVLTVVCPQREDEVLPWVRSDFGLLEPGGPTSPTVPPDPDPTRPGGEVWTSPGLTGAHTAVVLRTPDPAQELEAYVATMVVAGLLERAEVTGALPVHSFRARCGTFGPLDARTPDLLLATAVSDPAVTGEAVAAAVGDAVSHIAAEVSPLAVADAAERAAVQVERSHSDLGRLALGLGRSTLLLDDPAVAVGLPARLRRVEEDAARAVAGRLAGQYPRWTRVEPGAVRTRPDADDVPWLGPRVDRPRTVHRRPVPVAATAPAPPAVEAQEAQVGGMRVLAVRHPRAPLTELRLRVPVHGAGWQVPGRAVAAWAAAQEAGGLAALRDLPGIEMDAACSGQWADVSVSAPPRAVGTVAATFARVLSAAGPSDAQGVYRAGSPDALLTDVLRVGWTEGAGGRDVLDVANAVLVVVGADEPSRALGQVAGALADLTPARLARHAGDAPGFHAVLTGLAGERPAGAPAEEYLDLLLAGPEPASGADAPARYLATTVLGGYPGSRLAAWCRRFDVRVVDMSAGRDLVGPYRRAFVRVRTPVRLIEESVEAVGATVHRLATEPPDPEELRRAARYAEHQFQASFDSPASLADAVRHTTASGRSLDWVLERSTRLREVDADAVSAAAEVFADLTHSTVTIGRTTEEDVTRAARKFTLAHMESVI